MATPQDNSGQHAAWNGPTGDTWTAFQDALDVMLAPVTAKLLPTINAQTGEYILDVGCGNGEISLALTRAVGPTGHVTGLDLSTPLIKNASARSAKQNLPVEWIEADAANHNFDKLYDKIVSRFGVMFFAEPVAAFANILSALKPDGEMIFICWRTFPENPWIGETLKLASQIVAVPPRPEGYAPGPFGLGEQAFMEQVFTKAGFATPVLEAFDIDVITPGETLDEQCKFMMRMGPMGALAREASLADRERIEATARQWLEQRASEGLHSHKGGCWLVRAKRA